MFYFILMSDPFKMNISFLLFTVLITAQTAFSTSSYKTLVLENNQVCALNYKNIALPKRITVGKDGLIIKETTYFDKISNERKNFHCHFEVESSSPSTLQGLFVVIQNLHFRQNPDSGECIDYVRVRPVDRNVLEEISNINFNTKKSIYPWTTFCGDLRGKRDGGEGVPDSDHLSRAGFLTENIPGVEVEIFVQSPVVLGDELELQLLFTPYIVCKKSWSEYRECGNQKCIQKNLFGDGFVNCPFLHCPDEDGCDVKIEGRPNPVELSPMAPPAPASPANDPAPSKDLPPAYETLFPDR